VKVDEGIRRIGHRLLDLRRHTASAKYSYPAPAVNNSLQPEAVELGGASRVVKSHFGFPPRFITISL
jgi:hypothetical protein